MKALSSLYHFLGGIRFALILIAAAGAFVVAGTFIESGTQSHHYAANLTYNHPLFLLLLWGFFINILFSALRRYPFQVRHLPFLTTHIGLLMILGGVLLKGYIGLQGAMFVMEGAGTHLVFVDDTYAVQVEEPGRAPQNYEIKNLAKLPLIQHANLNLQLIKHYPHSSEQLKTWIKGEVATIQGLKPILVHKLARNEEQRGEEVKNPEHDIPLGARAQLQPQDRSIWELYALCVDDMQEALRTLYQQGALLKISDRASQVSLATVPLKQALTERILLQDPQNSYTEAMAKLSLNFSDINGFESPTLEVHFIGKNKTLLEHVKVPLSGPAALLNSNQSTPYLGDLPLAVDIVRAPSLSALEDPYEDTHLIALDAHGRIWHECFATNRLQSYIAYDEGFGGYAVQTTPLFAHVADDRKSQESWLKERFKKQLSQELGSKTSLAPPLQMLKKACQKANVDFTDTFFTFLDHWNSQHSWLYQENQPLPESLAALEHLNWQKHPKKACQWTAHLFSILEPSISLRTDLLEVLRLHQWPLIDACEALCSGNDQVSNESALLILLTNQIFSAADQLPVKTASSSTKEQQARLFSAYLRAYHIHLSTFLPHVAQIQWQQGDETPSQSQLTLETPLLAKIEPAAPSRKLEDNVAAIVVRAQKDRHAQTLSLRYDRLGLGLKWPILNGSYLLRFQPHTISIPYHIRLRQARQINYANSSQAYSYESDIIVTDRRNQEKAEKTISMNHVHETWDGYRFYLSNISPGDESAVKRVHIIVNHDPAKYWLTYPGAFILSCGIILLFWMRPYKKN